MGNCKLPCAWVGVLMTPPNYGKIRQAKGKAGRGGGGGGGDGNVKGEEEEGEEEERGN